MKLLMPSTSNQAVLRVRLAETSWRRFNDRASNRRHTPGFYADMVFRYLLHDRASRTAAPPPDPAMEAEEVYFELAIGSATKLQLAQWSEAEQTSLAAFSGGLLAGFIHRFERDPRDLGTIHHLALRLEQSGQSSEGDLREAIRQLEHHTGVRLPPGYLARWLHTRVSSLVPSVDRAGARVLVTAELIDAILLEEPPPPNVPTAAP